jgi:hypothetical protein
MAGRAYAAIDVIDWPGGAAILAGGILRVIRSIEPDHARTLVF